MDEFLVHSILFFDLNEGVFKEFNIIREIVNNTELIVVFPFLLLPFSGFGSFELLFIIFGLHGVFKLSILVYLRCEALALFVVLFILFYYFLFFSFNLIIIILFNDELTF